MPDTLDPSESSPLTHSTQSREEHQTQTPYDYNQDSDSIYFAQQKLTLTDEIKHQIDLSEEGLKKLEESVEPKRDLEPDPAKDLWFNGVNLTMQHQCIQKSPTNYRSDYEGAKGKMIKGMDDKKRV